MVKIEPTIFRKYDIRGLYPKDINEDAAYNIGLAYATYFPDMKKVAVGGDARKSSPSLKEALIRGLVDGGKEVTDIGEGITPLLTFSICHYKFDGGIQISASHLEGTYNGVKMFLANAHPTVPKDMEKIQEIIEKENFVKSESNFELKSIDPEDDYVEHLCSKFKISKKMKIIIDSGNGSAGLLPEKIFKRLGCEVETIYAEPDDSFPHHIADPYKEKNMEDLKKKVVEKGVDIGIGYDGDGDRMGIVDANGDFLTGDDMLLIFTRDAMKQKKGPAVYDSRASLALIEDVEKHGQKVYMTVGYHTAVLDKSIQVGGVFAGETTGHYYFPLEYYLYDDGVFASLKIVRIASEQEDFVKFVKELPRYNTSEEIFIPFPDESKYQVVDKFVEMVKKKGLNVNDIDGARIDYAEGWGIVRPSNTSPFIKVKFEGKTEEDLLEVAKKMVDLMEESGIHMIEEGRKQLGI